MRLNKLKNFVNLKLEQYKSQWRSKTPKQKWTIIHGIADALCKAIGVRVYSDMKINLFSVLPGLIISTYLVCSFYTIWFHFNEGDILKGIPCTGFSGIVISCFVIYWKTIGPDRIVVNNVLKYGGEYIYIDDNTPSMYKTMFEKKIVDLIGDVIVIGIAISSSVATAGSGTLYEIFYKKQRVTLLDFKLPFLDRESDFVYGTNMLIQSIIVLVGLVGTIGIEIGAALVVNTISTVPELIHIGSVELLGELQTHGMSFNAKMRVHNTFIQLRDFDRYFRRAFDMYYWRLFVAPYLFTYSISFSIFGCLFLGSASGYGSAMCNFILLVYFCSLGESTKQSRQSLAKELYGMPWYLLSIPYQRDMLSAINMVQNGPLLTIGPFAQLNLETASNFTIQIYRFTMMLIRAFK